MESRGNDRSPGRRNDCDQHKDDQCGDTVTLVLDDKYELTASRNKLTKSCPYLQCLLSGPYKEAEQSRIHIQSGGMFAFDAYEALIKFANDDLFIRDKERIDRCIDLLDLAILWSYDELVDVLEEHLIDCLSIDTAADIHTVANFYGLKKLQQACIGFERALEKAMGHMIRRRAYGFCPIEGHKNHHYTSCSNWVKKPIDEEEDWDAL